MDQYGIGNAVQGAAATYFQMARRSGRTELLVKTVVEGDVLVTDTRERARYLERRIQDERGFYVQCHHLNADNPIGPHAIHARANNRLIFDHRYLERLYMAELKSLASSIDKIQSSLSANGADRAPMEEAFKREYPPRFHF